MSYQVFARKYRPKTFADVLGQDHVVRTLRNAIAQNRLAHAYLFVGPRGTGKTSTARIFAKALNCPEGPTVDFDPNSIACIEIAEGRSMDVVEIDGASNNGVDQVRELRENVKFAPAHSRFKIYYIDEVHMLSTAAFNALLKTLEEPPEHVKFIFATTEANKILPTIISRCQRFDLRRISDTTIANHLLHIAELEGVALEEKAAYAIAKGADGGMRDAQSMMDQLVAFCGNTIIESDVLDVFGFTPQEAVANLAQGILGRDTVSALHVVNEQSEAGKDVARMLGDLIQHFRTLLVHQTDPEAISEDLSPEIAAMVAQQATMGTTEQMLRIVDGLAEVDARMRWASNKRLHFDLGIIQAVASMGEVSLSDVIVALDKAGGTQAEAAAAVQELRATVVAAPPSTPVTARQVVTISAPEVPKARESEEVVAKAVAVVVPAAAPQPASIAVEKVPEPPATRMRENPPEPVVSEPIQYVAPRTLSDLIGDVATPVPRREATPAPAFALGDEDAPPWNDKPAKSAAPALDGSKAWAAIIPLVSMQRPLLAHWVRSGTQLGFAKGVVKVGFPMSETHSRESLQRETTQKYLLATLAELLGQPVKLELVMDASLQAVPEPEYNLGLNLPVASAPQPVLAPASENKAPAPAKAAPAAVPDQGSAESPSEVPYDAFHDDELINLAVAKFKARIVKA